MPRQKPDHCHVANQGCRNAAAVACNGRYATNPPKTTWRCPSCDEVTCAHCRRAVDGEVVCDNCADEKEREARLAKPAPKLVRATIREGREVLGYLVEQALAGDLVIIAKRGKPDVALVPLALLAQAAEVKALLAVKAAFES